MGKIYLSTKNNLLKLQNSIKEYKNFTLSKNASQKNAPFPPPAQQIAFQGKETEIRQIRKFQYPYHKIFTIALSISKVSEKLYGFLFDSSKMVFIQNHSFVFIHGESVDERRFLCFYMSRSPHAVGKSNSKGKRYSHEETHRLHAGAADCCRPVRSRHG